jgi:hypothetical protein
MEEMLAFRRDLQQKVCRKARDCFDAVLMRKAFPGRPNDRTPGDSGDWRQTGGPRGRRDHGRIVVEEGVGHVGRDTKRHRPAGRCPRDLLGLGCRAPA